tara:strand:+ start:8630 stop:10441 length:1812 start_codon:yes stop_codon:yes gene_type:complete
MPGKPKDKLKYLESIDQYDFPYLIADILSSYYNHHNVRVVDGTGDGKRDIFSVNSKGEKIITQCKYHYDMSKTSGTRQTDEIVIALNKYKSNIGFFCTSGKLTPQSKREYLDNYPDFELNWLEGHEIVDIVLEDTILRKVWFENEKIHLTNSNVSIPFIFRKLPEDISLQPEINYNFILPNKVNVIVESQNGFLSNQFRPYNNLDIRKSGFNNGSVIGYEIKISGKVSYSLIEDIKSQILEQSAKEVQLQFSDSYVALRFGVPHLAEERNSYSRYKIEKSNFPIDSETFILKDGKIIEEFSFLIETNDEWKRPDRISMSQLSDFRFYNRDLDLVFNLYYSCTAKEELHPHVNRNIEIEKIIWEKSIFVLGKKNITSKFEKIQPDKIYPFGQNEVLMCWLHPRPIMYSADINQFEKELVHEGFEKNREIINKLALNQSMELINWEKASKIAAINDEDPFPRSPETSYRIVDIFETFHTLPSPMNPNKREFIFECVWEISNRSDSLFEAKIERWRENDDINSLILEKKTTFTIDDDTHGPIYLRVEYEPAYETYLSTQENLKLLKPDVISFFEKIEKNILLIFTDTARMTKSYWFSELGIFLDKG